MAGGAEAVAPFRELVTLLLRLTVVRESFYLAITSGPAKTRRALGHPDYPCPLNNGHSLRLSVSLYVDEQSGRLKVEESSYQYQLDERGTHWIFRYDYLREPGPYPHPTAHLQIRGHLQEQPRLTNDFSLSHIHFPTDRVSLEAVIRLLAVEFDVPTNQPPKVWRPVLTESEKAFREIAHRPRSGPET